ncbi:MAG: hypothetical protein U0L49_10870 [Eubacterium sp.]|nr:hypothetical protein [Eubacterium sp.]
MFMKSKTKIALAVIAGTAVVTGDLINFGVKKVKAVYNDIKYGASQVPVDVPKDAERGDDTTEDDTKEG